MPLSRLARAFTSPDYNASIRRRRRWRRICVCVCVYNIIHSHTSIEQPASVRATLDCTTNTRTQTPIHRIHTAANLYACVYVLH